VIPERSEKQKLVSGRHFLKRFQKLKGKYLCPTILAAGQNRCHINGNE
jgi:hypothetical protein